MEIFKDIEGYEGLYQISNKGRVKSLERVTSSGCPIKEKIRVNSTKKNGYEFIILYKDGKGKNFYIHRLVALAFIPNIDNKSQVNHIDENKSNNCVSNLEWVTNNENQRHLQK